MKRAQRGIVLRSSFLQGNVFADNANDVSLQLEILREVGGERHAMVRKIVSQSESIRNMSQAELLWRSCGKRPFIRITGKFGAALVSCPINLRPKNDRMYLYREPC